MAETELAEAKSIEDGSHVAGEEIRHSAADFEQCLPDTCTNSEEPEHYLGCLLSLEAQIMNVARSAFFHLCQVWHWFLSYLTQIQLEKSLQ